MTADALDHKLDHKLLFEGGPALYLVLDVDPHYTILGASDAYLQATMTERAAIVGRPLFDVFPDNPADQTATGERNLRASLDRVLSVRAPDRMAVQKYDIRRPESEGGGFEVRYWSPTNAPVLAPNGEVRYILHRVEDVTADVRREQGHQVELVRARVNLFHDIFAPVSDPTLFVDAGAAGDAGTAGAAGAAGAGAVCRLASLNPAAAAYLRRDSADLMGRPIEEVLTGAAGARIVTALKAVLQSGKRSEIEDFVAGDEGPQLRRVSIVPILAQAGPPTDALIVLHDVTAERRAIEATRASEARLRKIIDLVPVHVHVRDLHGRFLLANRKTAAVFGLSADELVGKSLFELRGQIGDVDAMMAGDRAALDAGGVTVFPDQRIVLGGEERIFYTLKVPYRAPGTHEPAVLAVSLDITDARRASDALRLSEARYRTQFEHAPEAILTLDVDRGTFVEANGKAAQLFGYPPDELLRLGPVVLSAPQQPGGVAPEVGLRDHIARALAGDAPVFEWMCRNAAGIEFPIEARLVRLPGEGNLVRGSLIDISERKRAEEERRRVSDLQVQMNRIQQANRLKSEFLANMSHELRTPLNAIIGFASLLHDGHVAPDAPEHNEFLGDILTSGRHLLSLINGVLDLAKVESGKLELHPELIDLEEVVAEVVSILRNAAVDKRVRVSSSVATDVGEVIIDPGRLKQVLYNLLSNALKFTPEGGEVTVRVRTEGAEAFRLEVEDTGIGIAPADLGRLFVEFEQLDRGAAKKHQGTGLGLALTKRLVEAHGGHIGVTSTVGRGSTFFAVLPRAGFPGGPVAREVLQRVAGPAGASEILVVEDVPRDRAFLIEVLSAAGYGVATAATGAQALRLLGERRYDAVTLDLILPDMTGLDLLAQIRAGELNARTPVIVATIVSEAQLATGFAVQDVLHKPFSAEALVSALARAGVPAAAGGHVLVLDDDPAALRLMETTLGRLGYRAECHEHGEKALAAAAADPPRAVILDLLMPTMDGFSFLERFRGDERQRNVPVIVWTQKELTAADRDALHGSVQGVIAKTGPAGATLLDELAAQLGAARRRAS